MLYAMKRVILGFIESRSHVKITDIKKDVLPSKEIMTDSRDQPFPSLPREFAIRMADIRDVTDCIGKLRKSYT